MIADDKQALSDEILQSLDDLCDSTVLPIGIKKKLCEADLSVKDVLVGSLGSVMQFQDNLARHYYYVPAKHISEGVLSVKHIAIAQSATLFGSNSGIRYYGEITETKLLPRCEIKFPMRRSNADEPYYAFRISEWKTLTIPIDLRYEAVYKPKLTNLFLLENCTQSYELFCIDSAEQFLIFRELTQLFGDAASAASPHYERVLQLKNGRSVWIHGGYIDVLAGNGERLLEPAIRVAEFVKRPRWVILEVVGRIL